jgi:hypothetical protein
MVVDLASIFLKKGRQREEKMTQKRKKKKKKKKSKKEKENRDPVCCSDGEQRESKKVFWESVSVGHT